MKRERERDESWPVGLSAEPEYFSAFPSLTERERALRDREEEKPLKAAEGDRKAAMAFGDREKKRRAVGRFLSLFRAEGEWGRGEGKLL